jgi:hypothetical protein
VITYSVYQFDSSGKWIGLSEMVNPSPPVCPETADTDVVIDDIDYASAWLRSHLKVSRQGT